MARKVSGIELTHEPVVYKPTVIAAELKDDGVFPNNKLPLLLYRKAVSISEDDPAHVFEELFKENGWCDSWRNGIYPYQHYHSTAHEVLGVYRGSAKIQLGGERGVIHDVKAGDVIVIPAGVSHKNLGSSDDFGVVGAYPEGQEMDMNYGKASERERAIENIAHLGLPKMDPVLGEHGPLIEKWRE